MSLNDSEKFMLGGIHSHIVPLSVDMQLTTLFEPVGNTVPELQPLKLSGTSKVSDTPLEFIIKEAN